VFHIAGHDSSSATITFMLNELTRNEELMKRAKEDIKMTLEKHNGNFNYESVMDMKFIDLCVKETLRKYPILPVLNRECTKDYRIPGTEVTIQKGTALVISVLGLHRDKNLFPNPEKYNPDRFAEEIHDYDEDAYMPFGIGPRNCLGEN
jgi:cytochrome P450 family 6